MEELKATLISLAGVVAAAILGYLAKLIQSKLSSASQKAQEVLEAKLNEWLEKDSLLLGILRNIYQTFVKKLKADGLWTDDKMLEAINKAFDSLMNLMPKAILKIVKTLYPDIEKTLKQKIQNFYEANKAKINIDIKEVNL